MKFQWTTNLDPPFFPSLLASCPLFEKEKYKFIKDDYYIAKGGDIHNHLAIVDIPCEKEVEAEGELYGVQIKGRADFVCQEGNERYVVEVKTGREKKEDLVQAAIYAKLLGLSKAKVVYITIKGEIIVRKIIDVFPEEYAEEIKRRIEAWKEKKPIPGYYCQYCGLPCPYKPSLMAFNS